MRVKLQAIKQELRRRMHQSIPEQGRWLKQVVTGYFNYHAVPTNGPTLTAFRFHVTNLWRRTLRRRSQKDWTPRNGPRGWPTIGSQNRESFTPGRMRALQSDTQGGSRMPELGPYGSVRGARGNSRPYRDPRPKRDIGCVVQPAIPVAERRCARTPSPSSPRDRGSLAAHAVRSRETS